MPFLIQTATTHFSFSGDDEFPQDLSMPKSEQSAQLKLELDQSELVGAGALTITVSDCERCPGFYRREALLLPSRLASSFPRYPIKTLIGSFLGEKSK